MEVVALACYYYKLRQQAKWELAMLRQARHNLLASRIQRAFKASRLRRAVAALALERRTGLRQAVMDAQAHEKVQRARADRTARALEGQSVQLQAAQAANAALTSQMALLQQALEVHKARLDQVARQAQVDILARQQRVVEQGGQLDDALLTAAEQVAQVEHLREERAAMQQGQRWGRFHVCVCVMGNWVCVGGRGYVTAHPIAEQSW